MNHALMIFTSADVRIAAAAIANNRGARHGVPAISGVLEVLPPHLLSEVLTDAQAALEAVTAAHVAPLPDRDFSRGFGRLTPREREVADLVCSGMTCKQAAQTLAISVGTAKIHLTHAYQKVGVSTRAEFEASYILNRDKQPRVELAEATQ